MSEWHISKDGKTRESKSHAELVGLIETGVVTSHDLVWTEGMPNWRRACDVTELADAVAKAPATEVTVVNYKMPSDQAIQLTHSAMQSLRGTKPWLRFVAIMLFIGGGLFCLGVVITMVAAGTTSEWALLIASLMYGVIATVYLMLGVYLNRYATHLNGLLTYRREDHLELAFEAQRKFWRLLGIVIIAAIGLYLVAIAVFGVFAVLHR